MKENKDKRSTMQKLVDDTFFLFLMILGAFCILIILVVV